MGVRWSYVNKQDRHDPLYRSRLVAKDYHNSTEPHLYTATPPLKFLCELPGQKWKAVENYGQRCQACLFLRAEFDAHVRPDQCRGFRAGRRTPMLQAACVSVWHEARRRKLAEVLQRSFQGKWIHHIFIFGVYLLSLHSKDYGVRAQ